ncbi:MAG: hypothetical protein JSW55_12040 [Chloroflexota bacterium]|nr:MAG: hypothetical protein JSW55_12040 [Chloroflexota bacterium]
MNDKPLVDQFVLRRQALWLVITVLLVLLAGCADVTPTRTNDIVDGGNHLPIAQEFQAFFEENGGLMVLGYPLTEAYLDSDDELLIQYFQRLRLEYDQSQDRISLTPLGRWAMGDEQVLIPGVGAGPSDGLEGSELEVQDAFLAFYEANGGEELFGRAISGELEDGGRRAQYFENALLEWQPDAPLDYRVQLGHLGEAHYRQVGIFEDPGRSRPLDSAGVREANVSAAFRAPILYAGEEQIVYVDVKTPEGQRPVAGVSVNLTVFYNERSETFSLTETDGAGHTHGTLLLADLRPGQRVRVVIEASAPGGAAIGATSKSFKSWW